jgi:hypothetical protein
MDVSDRGRDNGAIRRGQMVSRNGSRDPSRRGGSSLFEVSRLVTTGVHYDGHGQGGQHRYTLLCTN